MKINIVTELPGPKAKKILAKNEEIRYPRKRDIPYVMAKGTGVFQEDVDGNTFLDFAAGIAVLSTGTCHPRVVKAIQKQAAKFIHAGPVYFTEIQVELANQIRGIAPGKSKKRVFFSNSGAESLEAALKLARYKTNRSGVIAFLNSFHGRTYGAMSITTSKITQRQHFSPLVGGVYFANYPYCYRCPINLEYPKCDVICLNYIEEVIFKRIVAPDEIAAFIVEPIQGEGGYVVPPKEFHPKLKSLAEKNGILFIVDEVQTGMGRTGKWFAIENWGEIQPDVVAFAKGVASGMPLGGIIGTEEVFAWAPEVHGSTFGGNAVSCAAALETLRVIQEEKLLENAENVGSYIIGSLRKMQEEYRHIGDVRGIGLMVGVEFVEDKKSKKIAKEKRDKIVKEAFNKGLLLLSAGDSCIRICPPLVIKKEEADIGLEILESCIRKIEKEI